MVMQMSVLFAILSVEFIDFDSFRLFNLKEAFFSILMLALAINSYQPSMGVAIVYLGWIILLKNNFDYRKVFNRVDIYVICRYLLYFIATIMSTIIIYKFLIHVQRVDQLNLKALFQISTYKQITILIRSVYFKYTLPLLASFLTLAVLSFVSYRFSDFLKKIIIPITLLNFVGVLCTIILPLLTKNQIVELRMLIPIAFSLSLSLVLLMLSITNSPGYVKKVGVLIMVILVAINTIVSLRWQIASVNNNRADRDWSHRVSSYIRNHGGINSAVYFRDASVTNYSGDLVGDTQVIYALNVRAAVTDWSTIESLYFYDNLYLKKDNPKDARFASYKDYCGSRDWNQFANDQIKFSDNTAIICIY